MTADVLIAGAGPAGCSAALTLLSRGRSVLMADAGQSALKKARLVRNYPGAKNIPGSELLSLMQSQAKEAGARLLHAAARQILPSGRGYMILAGQEIIEAKGLILACGKAKQTLLPGETELLGAGVSTCATCDGMLYRDKSVAVLAAEGEGIEEEIRFLQSICRVSLYRLGPGTAGDEKNGFLPGRPEAVLPGPMLRLDSGELPFDGVFILRPETPLSSLFPGISLPESGSLRSSLPFVYFAGDILGEPYQVASAAGQGNRAALLMDRELRAAGL